MGSVLSQDEIDKLLAAIAGDDDEGGEGFVPLALQSSRKIRIYDFKRPVKFKKSVLRKISIAFEDFARKFEIFLRQTYKLSAHVHLCAADEVTFDESIRSIPLFTNNLMVNLCTQDFVLPVNLEISPEISKYLLSKIKGYKFDSKSDYTLDAKQERFVKKFMKQTYKILEKSLPKCGLNARFSDFIFEMNSRFVGIAEYSEMTALITLDISFDGPEKTSDMMNFIIPFNKNLAEQVEKDPALPEDAKKIDIEQIKIPVYQTPKSIKLSLEDLRNLKAGDTINFKTNKFFYTGDNKK